MQLHDEGRHLRSNHGGILVSIKPQSASFTAIGCQGDGFIVVDVDDASKVPSIDEPLFQAFKASIETGVAMTAEDLQTADDDIAQTAKSTARPNTIPKHLAIQE